MPSCSWRAYATPPHQRTNNYTCPAAAGHHPTTLYVLRGLGAESGEGVGLQLDEQGPPLVD
eukprot:8333639-Pyramimonas_sp.AAC.1